MDKYNKNNIHHNKRLSSEMIPSVLDRLYTKDIKKRRQNQMILTQIYTPTFTPFIYTKKENIRKHVNQNQQNQKRNDKHKTQTHASRYHNYNEEDDYEQNNNYNNYYHKTVDYNYRGQDDDDYDEEDNIRIKNNGRKNISQSKRNLRKMERLSDIEEDNNYKTKKSKKNMKAGKYSDNEDEELERLVVENAFRKRLFKHRK